MEESIQKLEIEIYKLLDKFIELNGEWSERLSFMIEQFNYARSNTTLSNLYESEFTNPANKQLVLAIFNAKTIQDLSTAHQDVHSSVSKIGKLIDKNFDSAPVCVGDENLFNDSDNGEALHQTIIEYLLRRGKLDIVQKYIKESNCGVKYIFNLFITINDILVSLKQHDLMPALNFVQMYRDELQKRNSDLEFQLHRMQFIEMLKSDQFNALNLIEYARKNLSQFSANHSNDIQELMGSLAYLESGIENSPYSHLLDSKNWANIYEMFAKDSYALYNVATRSPLLNAVNAGSIALPALNKLNHSFQSNLQEMLSSTQELPLEINVTNEHYHSIINCPILRQQCSDSNPPMRLKCGHVISKDALEELYDGTKIKCPYCSMEQTPNEAQRIIF